MAHRHLFPVHIVCRPPYRPWVQMGHKLVAEEIEIDPIVIAPPGRAPEQTAIEGFCGREIAYRDRQMKAGPFLVRDSHRLANSHFRYRSRRNLQRRAGLINQGCRHSAGLNAFPRKERTTMAFIELADGFFVAPQLTPESVDAAASAGVRLIINNRPDNEEPGQPAGADIEAAAASAGISYVAIPIGRMGVSAAHLDQFDAALAEGGPVLAFCRSGMRSTIVRAMARARAGDDLNALISEAGDAGYDIRGQKPLLEAAQGSNDA